jgi:N4-gp56 family major capsid protein
MSETVISSGNQAEDFDEEFFEEYQREAQFNEVTGVSENAVIQVKDTTRRKGSRLTISLIRKLQGAGVTGTTELDGAEENLDNFSHQGEVTYLRHGVRITREEEMKTVLDIKKAARMMLKIWMQDATRDEVIREFQCPVIGGGVAYASASEAQKDAWLAANTDRILFGSLKSNRSGTDHSASLSNVDTTDDKLTAATLLLMKRMAKSPTNGAIRPVRIDKGMEYWVAFAGSDPFRDLSSDSTIIATQREAAARGKDNPLFEDGDIIYKGIVVKEVPEMLSIGNVGATSAPVHTIAFCGAQALGMFIKERTKLIVDELKDYKFRPGISVQENRSIEKLFFNDIQHGMVTGYVAAAADA